MISFQDIEHLLSIAGGLRNAFGGSLNDFFHKRNKQGERPSQNEQPVDHTKLLREVLAGSEGVHDPLTGYWELFDWPVPVHSESMRGRRVERGSLILFYRSRRELSWHGVMTHVIGISDYFKEGPLSEPPFIATYNVGFQAEGDVIVGELVLRDKAYINSTPELEAKAAYQKQAHHKGQFTDCRVGGNGAGAKFQGKYETMRKTGEVNFLFRGRKRWADLQDIPAN